MRRISVLEQYGWRALEALKYGGKIVLSVCCLFIGMTLAGVSLMINLLAAGIGALGRLFMGWFTSLTAEYTTTSETAE